ncbi:hypothetical protein FRB95_013910 [Tulasnella sp. JGI-2019a]|nr:hypothetical protein FRB95_013910 [Tulasnella sp. JGI-2019a]
MAPKALSNGTLSLKFMQRRATAAGAAQTDGKVELAQAKVADDAEWDVGKQVREAWGLSSSNDGPLISTVSCVVSEASYLPFLRSSHGEDSEEENQQVKATHKAGRWNNLPVEQIKAEPDEDEDDSHLSDATPVPSSSRVDSRATKRSRVNNESNVPSKKKKSTKATPAQAHDFIKETLASISSDAPPVIPSTVPPTAYPVFLRPSGVDTPSATIPKAPTATNADGKISPKKKGGKRRKSKVTTPPTTAYMLPTPDRESAFS